MAERQAKAKVSENGGAKVVTRRLVMQRRRVLVLPDDDALAIKMVAAARKAAGDSPAAKDAEPLEAWTFCGEFDGSQVAAIEAYAGKPGSPDAKVGTFKAPPARSMKGGAVYRQPALPKVEREVLR